MNPGGSVKDRSQILNDAIKKKKRRIIVEGHQEIQISLLNGNSIGCKTIIVMPETQVMKKKLLEILGAELILVSAAPKNLKIIM